MIFSISGVWDSYRKRDRKHLESLNEPFRREFRADGYPNENEARMNVQLPVRMDKTAFLDWVQGREERYELDRGRVIMMTGGSRGHWQIAFNLAKALDARLDPNRWAVLPEFGVKLEPESVRFPDVIVDVAGERSKDLTATAPTLIAEVL